MRHKAKLMTCLLCTGAALAWLAVTGVQAQNPVPPDDPGGNALQAEIDELRERVADLETRFSAIEGRGGIQPLEFRYAPDGSPPPKSSPAPGLRDRIPQGEINGVPYYVIPLGRE